MCGFILLGREKNHSIPVFMEGFTLTSKQECLELCKHAQRMSIDLKLGIFVSQGDFLGLSS